MTACLSHCSRGRRHCCCSCVLEREEGTQLVQNSPAMLPDVVLGPRVGLPGCWQPAGYGTSWSVLVSGTIGRPCSSSTDLFLPFSSRTSVSFVFQLNTLSLSQGASHWNAGLQPVLHAHVVQEDEALERQSESSARSTLCSSRNTRAALLCDPQTRNAKWARGSRSQTHRRAAKGGFTQGDVKVRRPRPDRTSPVPSLVLKSCGSSKVLKLTLIPIPGPVQHRLSRCLE